MRLSTARQRDVAFASHQAAGCIEPDPSGAGQVDLGPCMKVDGVDGHARGTIEWFLICDQLDRVARYEPRRQSFVSQDLHQQQRKVAARATAEFERLRGRLHAGVVAQDVLEVVVDLLVEVHQEIGCRPRLAIDVLAERSEALVGLVLAQVRRQLRLQLWFIRKRKLLGVRFEEEVERVDDRQLCDKVDFQFERARLLGKHHACQIVADRILLPIEEVLRWSNAQRVADDWRACVRRRLQAHNLWPQFDQAIVLVDSLVVQCDPNGHAGTLLLRGRVIKTRGGLGSKWFYVGRP